MSGSVRKVADFVRDRVPFMRRRVDPRDQELAVHLRGNEPLFLALKDIFNSRIGGRAHLNLPSTANECMISMARDRELQWAIAKLDEIYLSPVNEAVNDGEPPE